MRAVTIAAVRRVGFALNPGDPFWVQVSESVRQRAEDLGLELVPVTAPLAPALGEACLRFLEDLKVLELDALISHALPEALMRAVLEDGLPLVCSEDTALTHPLLVGVHGLDQAAVLAAQFVAQELGGCGRVLVAGPLDDRAQTALLRIQGFRTTFARFPRLETRYAQAGWSYAEAASQMAEGAEQVLGWLQGQPVAALIGLSDSIALAARDVGRKLGFVGAHTLVAGINGDPLAIAAIEAGTMHATVETNAQDLGFRLAEFALSAARREPLPDHFPYSLELVSAHNVSQVAARKLLAIAHLPSRLVNVNRKLEEQRLVQMQTSLELHQRVGSILDQDELLATLAGIIRVHYDYDHVRFYFWSHSERTLTPAPIHNAEQAGGIEAPLPLSRAGLLGHALLNNHAVYIPDTLDSKRYPPDPLWPGARSRVALPVHAGGRVLGVLDLHSSRRVSRSQAELDALQTLANELGTALRNCQLYAQAVQARADAVQAGLEKSRLLAAAGQQMQAALHAAAGHCAAAHDALSGFPAATGAVLAQELRSVERSVAGAGRMAGDLLTLAQAEATGLPLHPQAIDTCLFVQGLFESAVRAHAPRKGVRWRLHIPAQLPTVTADPVRLRAALLNVLDNAARCTEHGQIVLGAEGTATHLHIWVQDTGCGIAPELLARLRQSLVVGAGVASAGAAESGQLGLGLVVADYIIVRHGGELQIESEEERGTTCHIRLPLGVGIEQGKGTAPDRRSARPAPQARVGVQLVDKTRAFIAEHYALPLTREQIANALSVSPAYVSRVFRQQTGMTLWDYVNSYRVARACELLYHSDMSVTEVAFAVGFNDPAYFSRVFRKETGKSPQSHRHTA